MSFSIDLFDLNSKSPAFSITIEGKDITTALDTRLMSLTLTNNRGFEADQLGLERDDADGKIILPRRGAVIQLSLGWKGRLLFPKGGFTVDEIEHSGAPDRLTIRSRSADFRETLNIRSEKSWHQTTVGDVVKELATQHHLKTALDKEMAGEMLDHMDQTSESDAPFSDAAGQRVWGYRLCEKRISVIPSAGTGQNGKRKTTVGHQYYA